jgi:hypothetical protein
VAVAALVVGLMGTFLPCLIPASLVLGLLALLLIRRTPGLQGTRMALVGIAAPLLMLPVWASIAGSRYGRYLARNKQLECRQTLKQIATAEENWFRDHGTYSTDPVELGFFPKRGNRYSYLLASTGPLQTRRTVESIQPTRGTAGVEADTFQHPEQRPYAQDALPPLLGGAAPGVTGTCPKCSFTAACLGNVDADPALDVWSVSSQARTGPNGETADAWEPYHDAEDLDPDPSG